MTNFKTTWKYFQISVKNRILFCPAEADVSEKFRLKIIAFFWNSVFYCVTISRAHRTLHGRTKKMTNVFINLFENRVVLVKLMHHTHVYESTLSLTLSGCVTTNECFFLSGFVSFQMHATPPHTYKSTNKRRSIFVVYFNFRCC